MKNKGITAYKLEKDTGIKQSTFSHWKAGSQPPADKLEEIRKNNRERQRKFREKSKVESNVTETLGNNIE